MKSKLGGVFAGLGGSTGRGGLGIILAVGAALSLIGALVTFVLLTAQASLSKDQVTAASEMRVLSQEIAKTALEAAAGNLEAFRLLNNARSDFADTWELVKDADTAQQELRQQLDATWVGVQRNVNTILNGEDTVLDLHEVADTLALTIPSLQEEYEGVVDVMVVENTRADQVVFAQRQSLLAERVLRSIGQVLDGGKGSVIAANSFGRDAAEFARVLNGMLEGDDALGVEKVSNEDTIYFLTEIADLFDEFVSQSVDEILETAPELFEVRMAADEIFSQTQKLLEETTQLSEQFEKSTQKVYPSTPIGLALALLALLFVALLVVLRVRTDASQRVVLEAENQRNQAAILRLLDELGDLADGDLTVQATVTEDFTGAIADSINFSIDQLRSLVQTINESAVQVASAAQETRSTAMHLAEASEHQAQEIAGASAAVNEMAVSIDQVSANAAESSAVAERSVGIANKGAEVVQATISGMDTIREQIQETSKRIKRLGESSQEIGDIVSLINDIADQTNILALNAAIQASMAGEAGRGFAVVADEVQRLAERSTGATKQIETLVKTIQADTNEAVISMEHTTTEVVKGARLAQDAGVALEEIESVSKNLADLIQSISNAARQQAASAGHISNTMNVIQEITSQTSAGTTATARSIGNLASMAQDMRDSVAGFRLPE